MSDSTMGSAGLPPFPDGWFVIGFSDELPPGRVVARTFMGREVVLFRTTAGHPCLFDAHCPHMGAHLGHGGTVVGESIRCPFHGFCFDVGGTCVATGYGTKPPAAHVGAWTVHETDGLLLAHHDASGGTPTWRVPELPEEGWTRLLHRAYTVRAHPQETTENSVDLGHFALLHGFRELCMRGEVACDGPYLSTSYAARWVVAPLGSRGPSYGLDFEFRTHIHGLGYSLVEATVPALDVHARLLVLPTPVDAQETTLRLALRLRRIPHGGAIHPFLRAVPGGPLTALAARGFFEAFADATRQDIPIWEHKRYVERPALAKGDGPIGVYRRWARQFYPEPRTEIGAGARRRLAAAAVPSPV